MAKTNKIEIFRAGTHTGMSNRTLTVSKEELIQLAEQYNAGDHEAPVVVGHPKHDNPAYAWVENLSVSSSPEHDGVLIAELKDIDPAFSELVKAKRYKKISSSFFGPKSPSNPNKGKLTLKHVGILGAMAPAVTGLKSVAFSEDGEDDFNIDFAEYNDSESTNIILKKMSDGIEKLISFTTPNNDNHEPKQEEIMSKDNDKKTADAIAFAEAEAKLDADKKEHEAVVTAFAERESAAQKTKDEATIDGLVASNKILPKDKGKVTCFVECMREQGGEVSFGEGDEKISTADSFLNHLAAGDAVVNLGEHSKDDNNKSADSVDFSAPAGMEVSPQSLKALAEEQAKASS